MTLSTWQLSAIVASALCVCSHVYTKLRAPGFNVAGKHVFITGGSLGLGLSLAKKYAEAGAKVSIVARNLPALKSAKAEIESVTKSGYAVFMQSCDVTDFKAVEDAVNAATMFHGRTIDHLQCCAGFSIPGYFADQDIDPHRKVMDVNYFGVLHTIKAAFPSMSMRTLLPGEDRRRVVLVSSGLGMISWIGYASYSPSKYALRGLAEALRNEFILYDIEVSIYYPGNIVTPGYLEQDPMLTPECKLISGSSAEVTPESAAQALINGIKDGQYVITNDFLVYLLRAIANGVIPRNNTPLEVLLMPLIVVVQIFYGLFMDIVVKLSKRKRQQALKQQRNKPNEHTKLTLGTP